MDDKYEYRTEKYVSGRNVDHVISKAEKNGWEHISTVETWSIDVFGTGITNWDIEFKKKQCDIVIKDNK